MQEKDDDLTLRGIPSRWNEPLTTSDIQEKKITRHQCQSTRETPKGGIPLKHNLSSATTNQEQEQENRQPMCGAKFQTSEPTLRGTKCQQTKKETVQNLSGIHCWMTKTFSKEETSKNRIRHLQLKGK